ncbi:MAG: hypothetical protein GX028_06125 [Clostridiaceae bacterium]|nr:hypothetical protein [Clostridiaceae bacterium]
MFGKLIKHEFRATRRLVPFIWLAVLVMASLNLISSQIGVKWLSTTSMILLVLLAIGQVIVTYVVIITRYYRSLYTDEGYLTHTIPARAGSLLGSKVLTSFVWIILSIVAGVTVFLVILFYFAKARDASIGDIYNEIKAIVGFENKDVIIASIIGVIMVSYTILLQLAQMFFAMSFGSQARFHKLGIAGPIICYLILNFILEMITLAAMVFVPLGLELQLTGDELPVQGSLKLVNEGMIYLHRNPDTQNVIIGLGGILFSLIAMAALYWGTYKLIKKRTSLR